MAIEIVEFPMKKWWFSIAFCMFTRGYVEMPFQNLKKTWTGAIVQRDNDDQPLDSGEVSEKN